MDAQVVPRKVCAFCGGEFAARKDWQKFCCAEHRTAYDQEFGTLGKVATVRKIKTGVSVSIHLTGPAAERALNLELGSPARITRPP